MESNAGLIFLKGFAMTYENILVETPAVGVGVVRLNRPQALNALNNALLQEVHTALSAFEVDSSIGCMIITGSDKAFAAGADIKEMANTSYVDMFMQPSLVDNFGFHYGKPIIAAVSGFALGGGCELAMACDMIVASETAVFGQPEITLGILPGGGGTQRLTRAVGKALAMEIMLADRRLTAEEALRYGLVNRLAALEMYFAEAVKLAQKIAGMSQVAVRLTKNAINKTYETTLTEGLEFEKRNFYMAFGTQDKQEGMQAFIEKRKANWKNK
jgi:enoyl-CoA hydratase